MLSLENIGSKDILKVFKGEIPSIKSCASRKSTTDFPQTSFLPILQTGNRNA